MSVCRMDGLVCSVVSLRPKHRVERERERERENERACTRSATSFRVSEQSERDEQRRKSAGRSCKEENGPRKGIKKVLSEVCLFFCRVSREEEDTEK